MSSREAALFRWLEDPRLGGRLVVLALLLSSTALLLGFYLDDIVALYVYSDKPGADELFRMYTGGYGLATSRADVLWQMEAGHAPWWTYQGLRVTLFRPLSLLTHLLDGALWLGNSVLMHAHNLFWLALLVLAVTAMYRRAHPPLLAGMAALLFAVDHTHGFEVGYICNRHALVAAVLGALALAAHVRGRSGGSRAHFWAAPALYLAALLSSESAVAIFGYVFAYALLVETGPLRARALSIAPHLLVTAGWRAGYKLAGYGSVGSGLYLDPATDPLRFLAALAERAPVLLQGLFAAPPAELYAVVGSTAAALIWAGAALLLVVLALSLGPLLARDRHARFWCLGMLGSLVPAASTFPANRQLLFASFGGMALIAQLWHLHAVTLRGQALPRGLALSGKLGAGFLLVHLVLSPVLLPLTTCSIAFATPLQRAHERIGDEIAGKDLVVVTAPEYFAVRLLLLSRHVAQAPLPRRLRTLSFGAQEVVVHRRDARTLELRYEGGLLADPFTELFRDKRIPMHVGEQVHLQGLVIEVLEVTRDSRAERVRFTFDLDLSAPSFVFYAWKAGAFTPFVPPPLGQSVRLEAATTRWGLW